MANRRDDTNSLRYDGNTDRQGTSRDTRSIASMMSYDRSSMRTRMLLSASDTTQLEGRTVSNPSLITLEKNVRQYLDKRQSSAYRFYPGTERTEFDYMEERTGMHTTNIIESIAHLIKGSLGAGVLSMHEAYMNGGLWTSLAVSLIIGCLLSYNMMMLGRSAEAMYERLRVTKLSYPDLAEAAAGTGPWQCLRKHRKSFRYTVDLCLFLETCGTCCIYQMMVALTLKQVIEGMNPNLAGTMYDVRQYILMSTPGLILLVMIRSLKFLAPFAMIADIFVGMSVMTTLYYSLRSVKDDISQRPAWKNTHGFMKFCGICLYCTSGVAVCLPVENNMKKPKYFRQVVQYAMATVIILICLTGFFGYWGWGEDCVSPITIHLPINTFTTILQFLLVMMLSTTYAVQFWVPFRIVWHYISRKHKRNFATWERFYRLILALIVTCVALAFPNIVPIMIFLGQFFLGFIAFIFPAFIEFFVTWEEDMENKVRWRLYKNFCLIVMGLFLSACSFYSTRD